MLRNNIDAIIAEILQANNDTCRVASMSQELEAIDEIHRTGRKSSWYSCYGKNCYSITEATLSSVTCTVAIHF